MSRWGEPQDQGRQGGGWGDNAGGGQGQGGAGGGRQDGNDAGSSSTRGGRQGGGRGGSGGGGGRGRGDGGGSSSTALVPLNDDHRAALTTSIDTIAAFSQAIAKLRETAVVLTPVVSAIPPGMGIALALVELEEADFYKPAGAKDGEVSLGKNAINRIAAAAGVRWDPALCRRLDDGKARHYVRYGVAGLIEMVDGTMCPFSDEKELDYRDDGSEVVTAIDEAVDANRRYFRKGIVDIDCGPAMRWVAPSDADGVAAFRNVVRVYNDAVYKARDDSLWKLKDPFGQIFQVRAHLLSHAITKAKLRALRAILGLPTKGQRSRMQRFVVAKPFFSGRNLGSPEADAYAAQRIVDTALAARGQLFAARTGALLQAPTAPQAGAMPVHPAPPPGHQAEPVYTRPSTPAYEGGNDTGGRVVDIGHGAPGQGDGDGFDPDEDSWDGRPGEEGHDEGGGADRPREPDHIAAFRALNRGDRASEIEALARHKARWGTGEGLIDHRTIAGLSDDHLVEAFRRLCAMPDPPAPEGTPTPPSTAPASPWQAKIPF